MKYDLRYDDDGKEREKDGKNSLSRKLLLNFFLPSTVIIILLDRTDDDLLFVVY